MRQSRPVVVGAPVPDAMAQARSWFGSLGWRPWPFQEAAWRAYWRGESGVIQVATGAGKTFAATVGPIAELACEGEAVGTGLRMAYVSPLRAVSRDIELALRSAVEGLGAGLNVQSRTGDTPASVRSKQAAMLPHILVTTPESLTLLLTREEAPAMFSGLRCVIVDEWHELLPTKRGVQVQLALSRLRRFSPRLRAWGMSATLPNLEEAARGLVATGVTPTVITGDMARPVTIDTIMPRDPGHLPWAGHLGLSMLEEMLQTLDPATATLVFTNTRSQAERWFHAIAYHRPEWTDVLALHHGSLDRDERERVEAAIKSGRARITIATSSLDLGVDYEPIQRVIQVGSPKGVARLAQRAGRASHRPLAPCRISCLPTHALELVEIAAARAALEQGEIEDRRSPEKPLDALAQHLVTCAMGGGFRAEEILAEVRTAHAYADLTPQEMGWALSMVKDGGGTLSAYPEYHRVVEIDGVHRVPERRLAHLHRMNVGTITGDSTLEIRMLSGRSLGRIEEGFVAHLRENDRFVFAGRVVRFAGIREMVAYVRPAGGTTRRTPIWSGTRLPISECLAQAIRQALAMDPHHPGAPAEIAAAAELLSVQRRISRVPEAGQTLIEVFGTGEGLHLCVFPFDGRLVHAGLGAILALRLSRVAPASFTISASDYGVELVCPDGFPLAECVEPGLFTMHNLAADAAEAMDVSRAARLQFREVARVAGLVLPSRPGSKGSSRQARANAGLLYDVLAEFEPHSPLLEQARREVLERHFETTRLARTLSRIAASELLVVRTPGPTPLSLPILIERSAGQVSSETLAQRVERMRASWAASPAPRSRSRSSARPSS